MPKKLIPNPEFERGDDPKPIPNQNWVEAPYELAFEVRLNEAQVKALLHKQLIERMED